MSRRPGRDFAAFALLVNLSFFHKNMWEEIAKTYTSYHIDHMVHMIMISYHFMSYHIIYILEAPWTSF